MIVEVVYPKNSETVETAKCITWIVAIELTLWFVIMSKGTMKAIWLRIWTESETTNLRHRATWINWSRHVLDILRGSQSVHSSMNWKIRLLQNYDFFFWWKNYWLFHLQHCVTRAVKSTAFSFPLNLENYRWIDLHWHGELFKIKLNWLNWFKLN